MRLLLITGNSEVRRLVAEKLQGRHITLCANPAEAARLLNETSFDAILADMDIAPVEAFRALDEHAVSTPLIAITATGGLVFERAADMISKDQTGWAILPRVVDCVVRCRRAAESSWESNQLAGALFNGSPIAIHVIDAESRVLRWNKAAEQVFGWAEGEVIGEFLPTILSDEKEAFLAKLSRTLAGQERSSGEESRQLRRDGVIANVNVWTELLYDANGGVSGILSLVVDSSEKLKLEQQLRLAQRLEAVGQLAGGVAHDFNNLLTIISGHSDLALSQLDAEDPVRNNIEEVLKASHRASALTTQLLAFSRRQVLKPKVLDLNLIVADLEKMMRRLIGENIDLITILKTGIGFVKADPGQLEQVIVNLVLNARDAMPEGGKLIIETFETEIDSHYTSQHVGTKLGSYVAIGVSDTGHGMDAETQAHIFEPFFTTRELGKGTGLGLSTVYGIVKQSGGNIWVYSEPGYGTTFKIYLPLVPQTSDPFVTRPVRPSVVGGSETILLVEDEERVCALVREVLAKQGYTVLSANNGEEGLALSRREPRHIDLLLTDVVMPRMSGRELAENLVRERTSLKVLYMSGYTDKLILHKGMLEPNTHFLQKPFSPDEIARKVREVLDGQE